jgi:hypothetical protein
MGAAWARHGMYELAFKKPLVICRHVSEASCVHLTANFACFPKIKFTNGEQKFFKYGIIIPFVACHYFAL